MKKPRKPASDIGWRILKLLFVGCLAFGIVVAVFVFRDARHLARYNIAAGTIGRIAGAVELYALDSGVYPQTMSVRELVIRLKAMGREVVTCSDDPWGHSYSYELLTNGYTIFSSGPDGRPETEDDIGREYSFGEILQPSHRSVDEKLLEWRRQRRPQSPSTGSPGRDH